MKQGPFITVVKEYHPHSSLAVWIEETTDESFYVAKPLIMRKMEPFESFQPDLQPTLRISIHAAQKLMDNLWDCGLRPSEGTGSAGQLASVQKHLADMRQLVFSKFNISKPEG